MDFNSFKNNIIRIPTLTDPIFLGSVAGGAFLHNEIETQMRALTKPIRDSIMPSKSNIYKQFDSDDALGAVIIWGVGSMIGGTPETVLKGVSVGYVIGEMFAI